MIMDRLRERVYLDSFIIKYFTLSTIFVSAIFTTEISFGADLLAGIATPVKETFGKGSVFIKLIYMLEIFAEVYTYHKTKNITALIGIPVIAIFLTYMLTQFGV